MSFEYHINRYRSAIHFDLNWQIVKLHAQYICFFVMKSVCYLLHYKMYKYLAPYIILNIYIYICILMPGCPGCPDIFLKIHRETKICFLELMQIWNKIKITIIKSLFIKLQDVDNYYMYNKLNLLCSPILRNLFFISFVIILIILLAYQMIFIFHSNMFIFKLTIGDIWIENLLFICLYC